MDDNVTHENAVGFPRIATLIVSIGGLLMVLQGLIGIFFGSIYYGITIGVGVGISIFFIGIILIVFGVLVYSLAHWMVRDPGSHVAYAAGVIVVSLIALLFGGGYVLGSVLGIVGGIIGMVWRA